MAAEHGDENPRPPAPRQGGEDSDPAIAQPAGSESPADAGRALVRVTVNLTPRAVDSLDQACLRTHDSKTDTINRALVVYNLVLELLDRGDGSLTLQTKNGIEHVHLL